MACRPAANTGVWNAERNGSTWHSTLRSRKSLDQPLHLSAGAVDHALRRRVVVGQQHVGIVGRAAA